MQLIQRKKIEAYKKYIYNLLQILLQMALNDSKNH